MASSFGIGNAGDQSFARADLFGGLPLGFGGGA